MTDIIQELSEEKGKNSQKAVKPWELSLEQKKTVLRGINSRQVDHTLDANASEKEMEQR